MQAIPAAIYGVVFVVAARRDEARLAAQFGDAYRDYAAPTGMFVPGIGRRRL